MLHWIWAIPVSDNIKLGSNNISTAVYTIKIYFWGKFDNRSSSWVIFSSYDGQEVNSAIKIGLYRNVSNLPDFKNLHWLVRRLFHSNLWRSDHLLYGILEFWIYTKVWWLNKTNLITGIDILNRVFGRRVNIINLID